MYVSKKTLALVAGVVLVGAIIAVIGLLYVELRQANADLRVTKADLEQTVTDLEQTTAVLEATKEANANLTREHTALQRVKEEQDDALVAYEEQRKQLDGELAATRQSLIQSYAEVEKGNVEIEKGNTEIRRLDSELAKANTTIVELDTSRQRLQRNYNELVAANGTIDEIENEARRLRSEIARLEAERRPLILGYGSSTRSWFACTGSMEPKITCLDEATWLTDFDPADIVVGATIAYAPPCSGDQKGVAHRVLNTRVASGAYYFWTKGDAVPEADGCWVHENDVEGYIIKIHKNANMENAEMRARVNGARRAWLNAEAIYNERHIYYCGNLTAEACAPWLSSGARQELARAWDVAARAYDHYNCWYQNAEQSEHPGHIPYSC